MNGGLEICPEEILRLYRCLLTKSSFISFVYNSSVLDILFDDSKITLLLFSLEFLRNPTNGFGNLISPVINRV